MGRCGLEVLLELLRRSCGTPAWVNNTGGPNPEGNVCLLSFGRVTLVPSADEAYISPAGKGECSQDPVSVLQNQKTKLGLGLKEVSW